MSNQENRPTRSGIGSRMRQLGERTQQSNLRSAREQAVFLYFLIVFVAVSIYLDRGNALPGVGDSISMQANWVTEAGEVVDLAEMPLGNLELTVDISALSIDHKSLCMKSIDTLLDVYADGQCIYSYNPSIPKRLGASYGMYVHTVPIPENTAALTLRL